MTIQQSSEKIVAINILDISYLVMSSDMLSPSRVARSKSMPHVDLKRVRLQKQDSNLSEDSSSGFKDSGIERDDNLANSSSDIQQDFPSLPSSSAEEQVGVWSSEGGEGLTFEPLMPGAADVDGDGVIAQVVDSLHCQSPGALPLPSPYQHNTSRGQLLFDCTNRFFPSLKSFLLRFKFTKINNRYSRESAGIYGIFLNHHYIFSPPVGGVCLHVSRPRGRSEARGRGAHEGGALAQRPACHHHALRPEAARPPHPQAGASYLPAECYSPPRPAQHYYPEGGWGWCVAMASVLVNILAHGLQVTRLDRSDLC